jgi:Arc/MetJ-type ribon-helix-helix transcriptional regulator
MSARYDPGMTVKIAVSLPDDLVEEARRAVRTGRAASVSAYVADAMRQVSRKETLREVLDDIFGEIGHPTPERRAWARRALGIEDEQ